MKNLAGKRDCDVYITRELERCGIERIQGDRTEREVPASITGKLGGFTFERYWYYWVVTGNLPLEIAEQLYADPVGREDIRVNGHCGCPPPKGRVNFIEGKAFVTSYHIDTEVGLRLFAETLKRHQLV